MSSPFGWCNDGLHKDCRRVVVSVGGVQKGIERHCGCTTPGCPCAAWNKENRSATAA